MNLETCLPANLRGPATTIAPIAAGFSGAGVYRVEVGAQTFVLKISHKHESPGVWRSKRHTQHLAADAGLAPRIIHVDESHRAVVSEFVADRSFPALYLNPATHEAALAQLGRTLRRVHELPLPAETDGKDAAQFLRATWSALEPAFAMPSFVGEAVRHALSIEPPVRDRAVILSHNDVNPTNLIHDGERLLLLDWDSTGPNDPYYDLAAAAVFLRMDNRTCLTLLAVYDGESVSTIPARFAYFRRLVAVLGGTIFLRLAQQGGHAGSTGDETLSSTLSLGDFYRRMMTGSPNIASPERKFLFGLALVKESFSL